MEKGVIELKLLNVGMDHIGISYMHPKQRNWKTKFFAAFLACLRFYLISLSVLLLTSGGELSLIASAVESIVTWTQGYMKLFPLLFQPKDVLYLIQNVQRFWNEDPNKINTKMYQNTFRFLAMYKRICTISLFIILLSGLVTHNLPFNLYYDRTSNKQFYLYYFLVWFQIQIDFFGISGMDILFIAACVNILAQLKLLNEKLENLKKENVMELVDCIKHHRFLMEYTNVLARVFSVPILGQYLVTSIAICMQTYLTPFRETFLAKMAGILYMFTISWELAMYCFPAEEVQSYASNISLGIYNCSWYTFPVNISKYLVIIIRRVQYLPKFGAFGVVAINREAFTNIYRGAVSFYLLLKSLSEN